MARPLLIRNPTHLEKMDTAPVDKELTRKQLKRFSHVKDETRRKAAHFSILARRAKGDPRAFGGRA